MTIGWQTTGHVRFLLNKYARRFMTLGICEGVLWQNLKFMYENIKNKRLQRRILKTWVIMCMHIIRMIYIRMMIYLTQATMIRIQILIRT